MLFKAFQIKNYKSFVDSGICSIQQGVTIFAGQNESGKSNILTALSKINDKSPVFTPEEYSFGQGMSPEITYYFTLSEEEISEFKDAFPNVEVENEICVTVKEKARSIACDFSVEGEVADTTAIETALVQIIEKHLPKFILYKTLTDDIPDTFSAQDTAKTPIKRLSKYLDTDFSTIFSGKNQQQQRKSCRELSQKILQPSISKKMCV